MEEAAELSRRTTQKALDDLQQHLAQDPLLLNEMADKLFEGGRRDQSYLLRRFARNAYPGRPYTQNEDDKDAGASKWLSGNLGYALIVALFGVFWVLVHTAYAR